jgi:tmRNA-binding protein
MDAGADADLLQGLALARGKDVYDKRQTIRDRESKRDMERAVREAHR